MGMGRASAILASGTMVSRITGLVRSVVLVAAIGAVGPSANAFAMATQLPNNIFAIIQTGLLSAVVIPQIVKASATEDGGAGFISKLFTLATTVLLVVTGLATVAAPVLIDLYAPHFTPDVRALAIAFAYWVLPQIFFYGLFALVGETLNARRIFGPYAWAPIANNIISIAGFLVFMALFGGGRRPAVDWDESMILLLALTATAGVVVQAGILLVAWRRTGLRLRPDFRWRGVGLSEIARLAGWTFLMVVVGQVAGLVQTIVMSVAEETVSVAVFGYAWLIYMLPYSIIVVSIGTPYFTQLSEHAHAGRHDEVRGDIDRSIRTLGVFIVAALAALVAAAVPASRVFTENAEEAQLAGLVLLAFLVALLPLSVIFIVQRTFYAYGDTRTPFFYTLFQAVLVVLTAWGSLALYEAGLIPIDQLTACIALGQSASGVLQTALAVWLLHRKLGSVSLNTWLPALVRFVIAGIPAGLAGWGAFHLLGGVNGWPLSSVLTGILSTAIIGVVVLVVYVAMLAILRTPELKVATATVRRFLPGR